MIKEKIIVLVIVGFVLSCASAQTFSSQEVERLRHIIVQAPDDAGAWANLGQVYLEGYSLDTTRKDYLNLAYDSFWEAVRIDYRLFEGHFGLGLVEFERGDYQAALFAFNQLTEIYPDRFDGHFNKAVTLARLRSPKEAAEVFREAIAEADPEASDLEKVEAYLGLAGQLKILQNHDAVVEAYGGALELDENDSELLFLHSEALYFAGKGLSALANLSDLESASEDARYSTLIADIYVQAEQFDYAKRSLERARRRASEMGDREAEAEILLKQGLLERSLGQEAEAARAFQIATTVDPSSWQAFYQLGLSYLDSAQPENALNTFLNALALENKSGELHFALATVYDQFNHITEAGRHADLALQYLPENSGFLFKTKLIKGRNLYRLGDYLAAKEALQELAEITGNDAELQLWLGLTEYQLENYDEATTHYEQSVRLDESREAQVNLGAAYLAAQRYADAEIVYEVLVKQNEYDPEVHYNLGWALLLQSKFEEAQEAWQKSFELGHQPAQEALSEYF